MALDFNKKVTVENLCNWHIGFTRKLSLGELSVPPKGRVTLTAEEIVAQCFDNNKLFIGEDGKGGHARIYIHDKDTRVEVGIEDEEGGEQQQVLTPDVLKGLFEIKTIAAFKKAIAEKVVSHAEKNVLAKYAADNDINDHAKIKFIEEYTGFKTEEA